MTPEIIQIIGALGACFILVAFVLNQTHKWAPQQVRYDLTNFFGSGLLIVYALLLQSIPFMILNGIWLLVSLRDLLRDMRKK